MNKEQARAIDELSDVYDYCMMKSKGQGKAQILFDAFVQINCANTYVESEQENQPVITRKKGMDQ